MDVRDWGWGDEACVVVGAPWSQPREYRGPLASCVVFAIDLSQNFPDHEVAILSDSHGRIAMADVHRLRSHPDFPA